MNDQKQTRRAPWKLKAMLAFLFIGATWFVLFAHPFLALNQPVEADIMIVEGWVPNYVLAAAAREYHAGHYTRLFISGMDYEPGDPHLAEGSDAAHSAKQLAAMGINPAVVEPCPSRPTAFNRTSHMARTVRDRLLALGLKPRGVNVLTLGPHGRQSLLAYQRMLGADIPVGIITVPKNDYDPSRWWASRAGIYKTTKDFVGWLKELIVGLRS